MSAAATTKKSPAPLPDAPEKKPAPKPEEELEFQIAADLTLYANPLRCLTAKKATTGKTQAEQAAAAKKKKEEEEGREMIAADLIKYGSPLDDK